MILLYLPLIVSLAGLLVYLMATNAKAQEVGRICFWVGLLAFLLGWKG